VNLSVKVSALTPLLRPEAPEVGRDDAARRMLPLLRRAKELGAHLHIDMESLDSREAIPDLVLALLSEEEFRDGPSAGVVLQAYLRDSPELAERFIAWAQGHGVRVIGGLPTEFADLPMPESTLAAIRQLYLVHGAGFLELPNRSRYPRSAFFDSPDHLNERWQIAHSKLGPVVNSVPSLGPGPSCNTCRQMRALSADGRFRRGGFFDS